MWIENLLNECHITLETNTTIYEDNLPVIHAIQGKTATTMIKHLSTRFFFTKDEIQKGRFKLKYIDTTNQLADPLTKPNPEKKFAQFKEKIGMTSLMEVSVERHHGTPTNHPEDVRQETTSSRGSSTSVDQRLPNGQRTIYRAIPE